METHLLPKIEAGALEGMTLHKRRDPLYVQLAELKEQRSGISPKLELHARLSAQIRAIEEELGDQSHGDVHINTRQISANGARMHLPKSTPLPPAVCVARHNPNTACDSIGCPKPVKMNGICKRCGRQKYKSYCTDHGPKS